MMGYYSNMMGSWAFGGTITIFLLWTLMALGIAALWKYINKK